MAESSWVLGSGCIPVLDGVALALKASVWERSWNWAYYLKSE